VRLAKIQNATDVSMTLLGEHAGRAHNLVIDLGSPYIFRRLCSTCKPLSRCNISSVCKMTYNQVTFLVQFDLRTNHYRRATEDR
jgi:hypothetical protein